MKGIGKLGGLVMAEIWDPNQVFAKLSNPRVPCRRQDTHDCDHLGSVSIQNQSNSTVLSPAPLPGSFPENGKEAIEAELAKENPGWGSCQASLSPLLIPFLLLAWFNV